jgi:hypothetical protein
LFLLIQSKRIVPFNFFHFVIIWGCQKSFIWYLRMIHISIIFNMSFKIFLNNFFFFFPLNNLFYLIISKTNISLLKSSTTYISVLVFWTGRLSFIFWGFKEIKFTILFNFFIHSIYIITKLLFFHFWFKILRRNNC